VSAAAYRARSTTELIDATFQLLRRNAAPFFTLAAMFSISNVIAAAIFVPSVVGRTTIAPVTTGAPFGLGGFVLYFLFLCVAGAVFYTAMTVASGDAYLGRPVVVSEALQRAVPKAMTMFVAYIVSVFLIMVGTLGLIVGGIIVALMLFAVQCVIVFEDANVGTALSRSAALSKGLKGHIFLTFLLAGVIITVINFIILFISSLAVTISPYLRLIVQALLQIVIVPIYPLVVTLLYYDARIRKEGYDIELMAQQVGGAGAASKPQPA